MAVAGLKMVGVLQINDGAAQYDGGISQPCDTVLQVNKAISQYYEIISQYCGEVWSVWKIAF